MICTKCHKGLSRKDYHKRGEPYWNEAKLRFVAAHQGHNWQWAQGWKRAISRAILMAYKYGDKKSKAEADAEYKLYVEIFREDIKRGLKI